MRSPFLAASLLFVLLFAAPSAAAQVDVSLGRPQGPMDPRTSTSIPVTFSADCATVLAEYEATGNTELTIELKEAPDFITGLGDTVPFSIDMCDPTSATVESTGNLVLTPGPMAPGLSPFELVIGAEGEESSMAITLEIAFDGNFTLETPGPEFILDEGGNGTGTFTINYTGNAPGMAMITLVGSPEHGTIEGLPETADIPSPIATNATSSTVTFEFDYRAKPGANFSMDMVALSVMMHSADDPNQMAGTQELMFHFMSMDHDMMGHDGHAEGHDHGSHSHADIPGFDLAAVLLIGVGFACIPRRRA